MDEDNLISKVNAGKIYEKFIAYNYRTMQESVFNNAYN